MLNGSGLPVPFLITPAWRNFLVACYSEAQVRKSKSTYQHRVAQDTRQMSLL